MDELVPLIKARVDDSAGGLKVRMTAGRLGSSGLILKRWQIILLMWCVWGVSGPLPESRC